MGRYSKAIVAAFGTLAVTAITVHKGMAPETIPANVEIVVSALLSLATVFGVYAIPNEE